MGNKNSSSISNVDVADNNIPLTNDDIFKVDNINSYGRKHASAKIKISYDDLCIRQKRRQSLHIPLETIKRYGIDGSIFILECGRRAPMGPARYAFRCKQAHRLVNTLDQRITTVSKQLSEQARQECLLSVSSISTLTNVSSTINNHHHQHQHHSRSTLEEQQRRRTQSDHSDLHQASSSSSLTSENSGATDSYFNSVPNLSDNYLSFERYSERSETSYDDERDRPFIARLKQPIQREISEDLNYIAVKTESIPSSTTEQGKVIFLFHFSIIIIIIRPCFIFDFRSFT